MMVEELHQVPCETQVLVMHRITPGYRDGIGLDGATLEALLPAGAHAVVLPNLHYEGYHPTIGYAHDDRGELPALAAESPLGDYHDFLAMAAAERGLANRLERGETDEAAAREVAGLEPRWLLLRELAVALGLEAEAPLTAMDEGAIQRRIEERRAAKAAREFAIADRIRAKLAAEGIELIDRAGGMTDWVRN